MELMNGEFNNFLRQIERLRANCIRQHRTDKNADATRIAYENVMDLIQNSVIYDGYNYRPGYGKGINNFELESRRIFHGDCKINFEEQVKVGSGHIVDGLIPLKGSPIVLEFDGYRHETEEEKERDRNRDEILAVRGYKVERFPEEIIKHDRSLLMTSLLNALYSVKRRNKNRKVPQLPAPKREVPQLPVPKRDPPRGLFLT